ncbi:MAG: PAS domain-containing protein [Acidobacteriia bacterium]|nr:PAS domain-containing protein [Terriglobia bacterium]
MMPASYMVLGNLQKPPRAALAGALIAVIAILDWRVQANIAFGFLYILPMLLAGTVLPLWGIVITSLLCTVLADLFDPFAFTLTVGLPQDILVFTSLTCTGLYSYEISRNFEREKKHLMTVELEAGARRIAEEQLEFLIQSSPAAILTMGADHRILRANPAADRLFGAPPGELHGKSIRRYLSALGHVELGRERYQTFRTEMQCRGEREQGDFFLANVFFSTYNTALGPRLAALVLDASDELRAREELGLEQLLAASRIMMGAVSHEVRNVCGAISVLYENMARNGALAGNRDFEALGAMVDTLNRIAALNLEQNTREPELRLDLREALGDLRIVLDPYCQEADVTLHWHIASDLPPVSADRHRLLQVLLNLTKNSKRALEGASVKRIEISAFQENDSVYIRVADSGPGVDHPERLFQPFQQGADSTGLGLYLSRAFMRSLGGDLRHDPTAPGCCFVIELAISGSRGNGGIRTKRNVSNPTAVG